MAVAFREKATLGFSTAANSTINKPAGTVDNDILIAGLEVVTTNVTVTPPTGWTEYSGSPFGWDFGGAGVNTWNHFYWKRASSEPANWTWTHNSVLRGGTVLSYSGAVTSGDPNNATPTSNSSGGAQNKNCVGLSITTSTDNSLAIMLWINAVNTGGQTSPSGYTEHGDPNVTFGAVDKTITPAGATGNQTETFVNNDRWGTFFIAIKPPSLATFIPRLMTLGAG